VATRQLTDLPRDQQHLVHEVSGRLASKFAGVFGPETIERFVVDSMDQLLPTAKTTAFLPLLTERFARERLQALAKVEGTLPSAVPGVLFLCVHNAGRSEPASEINGAVVEAMDEVGIDIRAEFPKPWTEEVVRAVDVVITMGCGDACPLYPGKRYEDWELTDPAGRDIESVRPIRDEIKLRVEALLASLGVSAG
jgi:protein-tyrosine-phosphatase